MTIKKTPVTHNVSSSLPDTGIVRRIRNKPGIMPMITLVKNHTSKFMDIFHNQSSEGELNSPEPLSTILTAGGRIADLPSEHILRY